jgi:hypothetical protein
MRGQTQERIEALAAERAATGIDLALVEEGIEFGKKMMAEMITGYQRPAAGAPAAAGAAAPNAPAAPTEPAATTAPNAAAPGVSKPPASRPSGLNEVGPMSVMTARREH